MLHGSGMDADPAQVIRSLRLALEMSQAEFARAAGWSPSTISSWERGRAKPSRLAFKTILAFAEERGVRYRPRATSMTALVPMAGSPYAGASASPGPRAALRPLLYPDRGGPDRGGATREGVPPAARPTAWTYEQPASRIAPSAPPRWSAEASFRVTLGNGRTHDRGRLPRGVLEGAIVVVAFAAAFTVRAPLRGLFARTPDVSSATSVASVTAPSAPVAAPVLSSVGSTLPPRARAATAAAALAPPTDAAESVAQVPPPTTLARLESVMAIGDAARATFRTANDAVTVVSGEWVGGQRVAAIANDGVTLVDRDGTSHRVRVGQHTPFE